MKVFFLCLLLLLIILFIASLIAFRMAAIRIKNFKKSKKSMARAYEALQFNVELDLVTIDLQDCYRCLKEIEGSYSKEGLLDEIFTRFCLGK